MDDLISSLKFEQSLIGQSEVDQEVANELRRAGTAATAENRAEIEALVRGNYALAEAEEKAAEAQQQLNERLEQIGSTAGDALGAHCGRWREGVGGV